MNTRVMTVVEAVAGFAVEKIIRAAVSDGTNPKTTESITVTLKMTAPNGSQKRYTVTQPLTESEKKILEDAAMDPPSAVILKPGL